MRWTLMIALIAVVLSATIAGTAGALLAGGEPPAAAERVVATPYVAASSGQQPDTTSPNWKFLSNDVGVMLRHDDRPGLRGRLYVRVEGAWQPVAIDGLADLSRAVPVR